MKHLRSDGASDIVIETTDAALVSPTSIALPSGFSMESHPGQGIPTLLTMHGARTTLCGCDLGIGGQRRQLSVHISQLPIIS